MVLCTLGRLYCIMMQLFFSQAHCALGAPRQSFGFDKYYQVAEQALCPGLGEQLNAHLNQHKAGKRPWLPRVLTAMWLVVLVLICAVVSGAEDGEAFQAGFDAATREQTRAAVVGHVVARAVSNGVEAATQLLKESVPVI